MEKADDPSLRQIETREAEWQARILLHPYEVVRESGRNPVIACRGSKAVLEVEESALLALAALEANPVVRDAYAALLEGGHDLDLPDFVETLVRQGFVARVNEINVTSKPLERRKRTHFGRVRQETVAWMHHPVVVVAWTATILAAVLLIIRDPLLLPRYQHVYFVDAPLLVMLGAFAFVLGNAYLHELAHLFMARSFGVDANISFGRIFHIIILKTDVTNAWLLENRYHRCLIFLAGMGYNLFAMSLVIIAVTFIGLAGASDLIRLVPVLQAMAFLNTIPLRFQFFLWIRTDLYYVLMTVFRHRALQEDSKQFVKDQVSRLGAMLLLLPRVGCQRCSQPGRWGLRRCGACGHAPQAETDGGLGYSDHAKPLLASYAVFSIVVLPIFLFSIILSIGGGTVMLGEQAVSSLREGWLAGSVSQVAQHATALLLFGLQASMVAFFALPALAQRAHGAIASTWNVVRYATLLWATLPLGHLAVQRLPWNTR